MPKTNILFIGLDTEHFYIYSESEHALNVAIERIKALCDAQSVMFNELDSLELLPVE